MRGLNYFSNQIVNCEQCPRLRKHCKKIAHEKRKQFMHETYWGKPVPGFGDSHARVFIVGLAPAAHGANRTGRMFTGDQSGLWLYRALHRAGFSNQAESLHAKDLLKLQSVFITAAARCAPPQNKPTLLELKKCEPFLKGEVEIFLKQLKLLKAEPVFLVLGQVALRSLWKCLPGDLKEKATLPKFKHGDQVKLKPSGRIFMSYHPSQQNTFTKKLTEPMFDLVFSNIKKAL